MSKFNLVPSLNRGAPRTNKKDARGVVRVTVTNPTSEGNITRSFSVNNATVTEVMNILTRNFSVQKTAAKSSR